MKTSTLLIFTFILFGCGSESDDNSIVEQCQENQNNEIAGCWLYEKCHTSPITTTTQKTGIILTDAGYVYALFERYFDNNNCTDTNFGSGSFNPNIATYSIQTDFINIDSLTVTEFHYIKPSGVTKKTFFTLDNNRLCFPDNTFMQNYDPFFNLTQLGDETAYNELSKHINSSECFIRVYNNVGL